MNKVSNNNILLDIKQVMIEARNVVCKRIKKANKYISI